MGGEVIDFLGELEEFGREPLTLGRRPFSAGGGGGGGGGGIGAEEEEGGGAVGTGGGGGEGAGGGGGNVSPSLPALCCCSWTRPVSSAIKEVVPLRLRAAISLAGGGGGGGKLSRAPPARLGVPGPASLDRGGGAGGG